MRGERIWLTLLVAGCLFLLAGAPLPQTDGDTMFYAYAARSIVQTGDWLIPRHPGFFFDKPTLTIWLMALSLRLLGAAREEVLLARGVRPGGRPLVRCRDDSGREAVPGSSVG